MAEKQITYIDNGICNVTFAELDSRPIHLIRQIIRRESILDARLDNRFLKKLHAPFLQPACVVENLLRNRALKQLSSMSKHI